MSNYRRLISYIYAYEGGVKGKNIGFVKIESRNSQCKITVSVKKIYQGNDEMKVYLLSGSEEILLGGVFVRNGCAEFRTMVSFQNIEQSGKTMDECHGLTLHEEGSNYYAYTTIWEDAVAHAAEIELEDVTSEKYQEDIIEEYQSVIKEIEEEIQHQAQLEELEALQEPQLELELELEQESEVIKEQQEVEEEPVLLGNPYDLERLHQEEMEEMEENNQDKVWEILSQGRTKLSVFDHEGGCEILTIKPQDIGLLPREVWTYGNNSFLLHGYYNYRYLILAKLNDKMGKPKYILGVPGHYYSNEKYMASMFGFPNFVLSREQPSNDGRFGYWYTHVKVGSAL